MLLEFNGYRVTTAGNGVEALAAANIERPDVIVSAQVRGHDFPEPKTAGDWMTPRGVRLGCSLKSRDGCTGTYSVFPGEAPKSISNVEAVTWDRAPDGPVREASFFVVGDMGMTGMMVLLNSEQWRILTNAKLETFFYAAILWGADPMKIIDDASRMQQRPTS